jgi:hypothetical protein
MERRLLVIYFVTIALVGCKKERLVSVVNNRNYKEVIDSYYGHYTIGALYGMEIIGAKGQDTTILYKSNDIIEAKGGKTGWIKIDKQWEKIQVLYHIYPAAFTLLHPDKLASPVYVLDGKKNTVEIKD